MVNVSSCSKLGVTGAAYSVKLNYLYVPLGLLSYCTSFMSQYEVLCYCSLAKLDPRTKSKTLVSHDTYGIVFMH